MGLHLDAALSQLPVVFSSTLLEALLKEGAY
jgi:hypothetical protein